MTVLAFAAERSAAAPLLLLSAGRAAIDRCLLQVLPHRARSRKTAAAKCGRQMMGQTDRRTDGHEEGRLTVT